MVNSMNSSWCWFADSAHKKSAQAEGIRTAKGRMHGNTGWISGDMDHALSFRARHCHRLPTPVFI